MKRLILISLLFLCGCASKSPVALGPQFYGIAGRAQQFEIILNPPSNYTVTGLPPGAVIVEIGGALWVAVPATTQAGQYQFTVSW